MNQIAPITFELAASLLKPRKKNSHKGTYGHALLIAGGKGKAGAAMIASKACLRSGAGLLTAHVPGCVVTSLHTFLPEVMISEDENQTEWEHLPENLSAYNVIGFGPGLGTFEMIQKSVYQLLQQPVLPSLVIDADGLNCLSLNRDWLNLLPENTILTPHPKEFERLCGKSWKAEEERTTIQLEFSKKYHCIVVLKDAETIICAPDGQLFRNTSGNPGMAKGGSGDALTGIITALLAQHYEPLKAAVLGVYLHGLAGDLAVKHFSVYSLLVSDLIETLPQAFLELAKLN